MEDKLILQIKVDIDKDEVTAFSGPAGDVVMIPFSGTAEGEIFHGKVRPGGVDCQRVNQAGVRHMCARYVLEGTDRTGKPCHIFIENNAWFTQPQEGPFDTVPTMLTDSEELAPYLHRSAFRGRGEGREGGVTISIFEIGGK